MAVRLSTGYVQQRNEGRSFAQIFEGGCMEVYTGAQPESADMPPTGTLLGRITRGGFAWTPGSPSAGLRFDTAGRYVTKRPTDTWAMVGLATGTAGWMRLVGATPDLGDGSLLAPRIDGAIDLLGALTDSQLLLPTLALTNASSIAITYWWFATPPLPGA